jgi:hypothetical protein
MSLKYFECLIPFTKEPADCTKVTKFLTCNIDLPMLKRAYIIVTFTSVRNPNFEGFSLNFTEIVHTAFSNVSALICSLYKNILIGIYMNYKLQIPLFQMYYTLCNTWVIKHRRLIALCAFWNIIYSFIVLHNSLQPCETYRNWMQTPSLVEFCRCSPSSCHARWTHSKQQASDEQRVLLRVEENGAMTWRSVCLEQLFWCSVKLVL